MFNMKTVITRALLALALVMGAGAASAGPTYRVAIDSSDFAGTSGYLDLTFLGLGDAAPALATLSNFMGDFGADAFAEGDAWGDVGTGIVLGNGQGFNAFTQAVNFGGRFSFDVRFMQGDIGDGTTFGVALINEAFDAYLGADGNLVEIGLMPGTPDLLMALAPIATINVVPEPSELLLMLTGLALLGFMVQRRAQR